MNKEKQNELADFLDWAKEYTNNKLDYGSGYLAQQYIKKHPNKTENLPISGVSESFSAEVIGHSRVKPLIKALEMIADEINSGAPPSIEKDGEIRDIAQFALDNFL